MFSLPIELVDNILGYLRGNELMKVRLVCKSINRLALNRLNYQVYLYGDFDDIVCRVQNLSDLSDKYKTNGIKSLAVCSTQFQGENGNLLNCIFNNTMGMKLKKLMLMNPNFISNVQLQCLLMTHPLEELDCQPFMLDEEVAWILIKYAHSLKNLSLRLTSMPLPTVFAKLASTMTNLVHLELYESNIEVCEIVVLLERFNLASLSFNKLRVFGSLMKSRFSIAQKVKLLKVDECDIITAEFYKLFDPEKLIVRNSDITSLDFKFCSSIMVLCLTGTNLNFNHISSLNFCPLKKIRIGNLLLPFRGISDVLKIRSLKYAEFNDVGCEDSIEQNELVECKNLTYLRIGRINPRLLSISNVQNFDLNFTLVLSKSSFTEPVEQVDEWYHNTSLPSNIMITQ
eukprot:NODE_85_length_22232_cov_1.318619.p3 type:complete len:399 gc:universal NODE_85_length_22232_cov_1.318619:11863-13059(+)